MSGPLLFAQDNLSHWLATLRRASAEDVLLPILIQLIVIILAARLFAVLFRRVGQPSVVGEIAAGILLGPSVLGLVAPEVFNAIFHRPIHSLDPATSEALVSWVFTTLSHLGLILLVFLIGLQFDFSHLRYRGRSAAAISLVGIAFPFVLGLALALLMWPYLEANPTTGDPVNRWHFALFMATALSITAIPVLGRIMLELGITRTSLGAITISAAAVDDAMGWTLLATVAAIVHGELEALSTLRMLGQTLAFVLFMVLAARPALRWWARRAIERGAGELRLNDLAILLVMVFGCALVTNRIGIFAILGAFVLGAVLSSENELRAAIARRLNDFVTAFFLPIFFTFTGLRTNVGSLESVHLWILCALVLAAAMLGKLGGCALAARLTGFSLREAACIGTMMNARGLMELVVVNVGYELGVIPPSVFCMLVIMALVTTVMTTPLLLRLMPGTELEPWIRNSGFMPKLASETARRRATVTTRPGNEA